MKRSSSPPIARPTGSTSSPSARKNGFKVVIAGAGGAAHLPGMAASMTPLPVLGVPMNSQRWKARIRCCRSCRCRPAFRSARSPSASPAPSMRRCSPPPAGAVRQALPNGSMPGASADQTPSAKSPEGLIALLKPGATIGILGGGQLGAHAGARRGPARPALPCLFAGAGFLRLRCGARRTCAAYEDQAALGRFAEPSTSSPMNSRTCRRRPPPFSRSASRCCPTRRCWR